MNGALFPLVAVVGPTGAGKSELGLRIAEEFGGEIVNCDSLQVYRHFDIGTAKLLEPERRGIPHHLIDIADPDEPFTAGEYARRARDVLREITERERLPVVAGGTGFYLRALLDGLFPGPSRDEAARKRLAGRETKRPGSLHRILKRLDPSSAARIHPHDLHKLVRALEVCLLARRPMSEVFREGRSALQGYRTLKIGLDPPRDVLYERLNVRCRRMFEDGLMDEVRRILALGYAPEIKPLESHGYRQALQLLRGDLDYAEALLDAQKNTRHYAKRQWTWFRRERDIEWRRGFGNDATVEAAVFDRVRTHLEQRNFTD